MTRRRAPTLVELCTREVAENLIAYAGDEGLSCLPWELAEAVAGRVLGRPSRPPHLHELLVLCEAFWHPPSLSLRATPGINTHGLQYLSYATCLVKLDLSSNAWLESVAFLPQLVQLQCLNLRDCWRLPEQCLADIGGLTQLRCLDLENVYSITDKFASHYLSRMRMLQSLNLSGTGVSDYFVETLTYGQRLQAWLLQEKSLRCATIGTALHVLEEMQVPTESSSQQWHSPEIVYLRLQHTKVSEASIPFLLSFCQLLFLDVRNTEISGRSLKCLQAKYRLILLPNNAKVLARSNSFLLTTLRGGCGCSCLETDRPELPCNYQKKSARDIQWEQNGLVLLLREASRLHYR